MAPENVPSLENEDDKAKTKKASVTGKIGSFLKKGLQKGLDSSGKAVSSARLDLSHAVGLGHKPNSIPPGKADLNGEARDIEIGWHPVAGATGKWFAEKTIIGRGIKDKVGQYPDPTQHWGVLVGGYVHQLWMDENLDVIYFNEPLKREEWKTYKVGSTRFNDQALRKAGQVTIHLMREKHPAYNLISNNCQNFATALLDKIQLGAHREFATALSVYQRATGDGEVLELWDKHPEEQIEHETLKAGRRRPSEAQATGYHGGCSTGYG